MGQLFHAYLAGCGCRNRCALDVDAHTPPASYQVANKDTQHEYTRVTGQTFCLFGVYTPRKEGADLAADLELEWTNVVAAKFTPTGAKAHPTGYLLVDTKKLYWEYF